MEEKIKNIEGAIILLTDILNRQDEILRKQDERMEKQDEQLNELKRI